MARTKVLSDLNNEIKGYIREYTQNNESVSGSGCAEYLQARGVNAVQVQVNSYLKELGFELKRGRKPSVDTSVRFLSDEEKEEVKKYLQSEYEDGSRVNVLKTYKELESAEKLRKRSVYLYNELIAFVKDLGYVVSKGSGNKS